MANPLKSKLEKTILYAKTLNYQGTQESYSFIAADQSKSAPTGYSIS